MLDERARTTLAATRFGEVRWFEEIDSTNRWLLEQAASGAAQGLVAVADRQTAGRGRLGRRWEAPAGASLLVSVLLRPAEAGLPVERLHLATVAVAVAAADAVSQVAGVEAVLKWPNDLLVAGRKLAGVLAEVALPSVVVGIGINCNWRGAFPEELVGTALSLDELTGGPVDRASLLVALLQHLDRWWGDWAALGRAYRRRCATLGQLVRVELPDGDITGVAADVTEEGHLLVETDACVKTVTAGDVIHLRGSGPTGPDRGT